jgi:putative ABC transport system permease protein
MLRNYILVSWRNLFRHKLISCVNIIGVAFTISVGLLALKMARNAFDVDSFHPEPDRTYRILTKQFLKSGSSDFFATTPYGLADYVRDNYPFIEHTTRIVRGGRQPVKKQMQGEEFVVESVFADPEFFNVFGLKLELGNPLSALNEPYSAVISANTGARLFGNQNPVGKTLTIGNYGEFTITGVLQKQEIGSRVFYGLYLSMSTLPGLVQAQRMESPTAWSNIMSSYTYVMVKEGHESEIGPALRNASTYGMQNAPVLHHSIDRREFQAQLISNLVYSPTMYFESHHAETIPYVPIVLSMLILCLGAFNYMNLTIAKIFSRVREVGVRKIFGATQSNLIGQFIVEAILIAFVSFFIALFLTQVTPLNKDMSSRVSYTVDFSIFIWFLLFTIVTGVICGIFPAVALSKVRLTSALKNKIFQGDVRTPFWQKGLLIIQFSVSLLFIIISLVMLKQTRFMAVADYGLNRKDLINIEVDTNDVQYFKNAFNQETSIQQVSASSGRPVFSSPSFCWAFNQKTDSVHVIFFYADENFVPIYGLTMISGQNFSDNLPVNYESSVIINEEASTRFGFPTPQDAIGQIIAISDTISLKICGVLENCHIQGFKNPIRPFMLRYSPTKFSMLTLKTNPGETDFVLASVRETFGTADRDYELKYSIFEDDFYGDDFVKLRDLKMVVYLSFMTVMISSLGLMGIVMYNTRARKGEIGIRKVMGANIRQIVMLTSRQFMTLLLISCGIALPFCYIISNAILHEYVYRVNADFFLYASGLAIMLIIGLIVICSQTIYAALKNPIETIRSE